MSGVHTLGMMTYWLKTHFIQGDHQLPEQLYTSQKICALILEDDHWITDELVDMSGVSCSVCQQILSKEWKEISKIRASLLMEDEN